MIYGLTYYNINYCNGNKYIYIIVNGELCKDMLYESDDQILERVEKMLESLEEGYVKQLWHWLIF